MITADRGFDLRTDGPRFPDTAKIYVSYSHDPQDDRIRVFAQVFIDDTPAGGEIFEMTEATLTAETSSGANAVEESFGLIQEAVITMLETTDYNAINSTSFTIS